MGTLRLRKTRQQPSPLPTTLLLASTTQLRSLHITTAQPKRRIQPQSLHMTTRPPLRGTTQLQSPPILLSMCARASTIWNAMEVTWMTVWLPTSPPTRPAVMHVSDGRAAMLGAGGSSTASASSRALVQKSGTTQRTILAWFLVPLLQLRSIPGQHMAHPTTTR